MNNDSNHQPIDPDLEARIVAFVMGEASESEQALLQQMIEERTDLAALKDHYENVHGHLKEVGSGEMAMDDDCWKLPSEKRGAVLSVISGKSTDQTRKASTVLPVTLRRRLNWHMAKKIASIAAVLCMVVMLGLMLMLPAVNSARETSRISSSIAASSELNTDLKGGSTLNYEIPAASNGLSVEMDAEEAESEFEGFGYTSDAPATIRFAESSAPPAPAIRGNFDATRGRPPISKAAPKSSIPADVKMQTRSPASAPSRSTGTSYSTPPPHPTPAPYQSAPYYPYAGTDARKADLVIDGYPARTGRIMLGGAVNSDTGDSGQALGLEKSIRELVDGDFDSDDADLFGNDLLSDYYGAPSDEAAPAFGGGMGGGGSQAGGRARTMMGDDMAGSRGFDLNKSIADEKKELAQSYFDPLEPKFKAQKNSLEWQTKVGRKNGEKRAAGSRRELAEMSDLSLLPAANKPAPPAKLEEIDAKRNAFSTFSLHVSDVSFKLAQAALSRGQWPDAAKVRIEEFVNAFDYGDPMPCHNEKVACQIEQAIHPILQQRNVLRVSMRTAAAGRASNTPLRLTLLLDSSGSMERIDRQQTVRRAFAALASQLKPIDQVTLISFARTPRLLADKISGSEAGGLVQLIENLPSEGGTNIESAIELAFEKAKEQQADDVQSRIILLTDGAVNLGDANPDSLFQLVKMIRDGGIAFDAAGISANGLNDEVLEALTRSGDGRYYLLDSSEDVDDGFAQQIAGALRPSAKNVKVQVEFNPLRVGRYRLMGFEKHLLNKEDFRNDTVDAAEMAAAESGVAVYQFEAKPDGEGDVGSVSVRFRDLSTGEMIENRWPIPYQPDAARLGRSTASLRIATTAAMFAATLRGEPLGQSVELKTLSELMSGLPEPERRSKRVQQLIQMINQARQVNGR